MISWKFYCMMIYVAVYICRGTSYRKDKKEISKFYCDREKVWEPVEYNSFLWSLERKNKPPVYLFGTVHAPYDLVWRYIPSNAKDALRDATHVYTEVNLKDPKVINAIRKCRELPGNLTLRDVLPKRLHKKLMRGIHMFEKRKKKWISKFAGSLFKDYLLQAPDLSNQYKKLKPVWLISTILQQWNKYAVKLLFRPKASLDTHLVELADEFGAYQGGIEDVANHCDPMDNLGKERVFLALNVTLESQYQRRTGNWKIKENDIRRVANLYKCGDPLNTSKLATLFSAFVGKNMKHRLEDIDEYFARELVYKRNVLMAQKIDEKLRDADYDDAKMFFAVGAAHFLGDGSVVELLQKKGYKIKHVKAKEDIPATIERRKLKEEGERLFKKTMDNAEWREKKKSRYEEKPIVIIKNVGNKVVYYYYNNGGSVARPCSFSTSIVLVLISFLWIYR